MIQEVKKKKLLAALHRQNKEKRGFRDLESTDRITVKKKKAKKKQQVEEKKGEL